MPLYFLIRWVFLSTRLNWATPPKILEIAQRFIAFRRQASLEIVENLSASLHNSFAKSLEEKLAIFIFMSADDESNFLLLKCFGISRDKQERFERWPFLGESTLSTVYNENWKTNLRKWFQRNAFWEGWKSARVPGGGWETRLLPKRNPLISRERNGKLHFSFFMEASSSTCFVWYCSLKTVCFANYQSLPCPAVPIHTEDFEPKEKSRGMNSDLFSCNFGSPTNSDQTQINRFCSTEHKVRPSLIKILLRLSVFNLYDNNSRRCSQNSHNPHHRH